MGNLNKNIGIIQIEVQCLMPLPFSLSTKLLNLLCFSCNYFASTFKYAYNIFPAIIILQFFFSSPYHFFITTTKKSFSTFNEMKCDD